MHKEFIEALHVHDLVLEQCEYDLRRLATAFSTIGNETVADKLERVADRVRESCHKLQQERTAEIDRMIADIQASGAEALRFGLAYAAQQDRINNLQGKEGVE